MNASRLGVKATLICASCGAEQTQHAVAANESEDACLVSIPVPAGWQVVEYSTYCPGHAPKRSAIREVLEAVQKYKERNPLDVLSEKVAA